MRGGHRDGSQGRRIKPAIAMAQTGAVEYADLPFDHGKFKFAAKWRGVDFVPFRRFVQSRKKRCYPAHVGKYRFDLL
jgi:hypothetical protein